MRLGRHELTLEPRPALPAVYAVLGAVVAILLALVLASVLFLSADAPLFAAYRTVFSYAFFNPHGVLATAQRSIYLLLCTYAFLVPLRAGLWNIGLPGQVYAGALAAFAVPFALRATGSPPALPAGVLVALMVAAAATAGAALGGFAGLLRARLQVNEILVTMMLNSILVWLVAYMIKEGGPFMGATAEGESFSLPPPLYAPLLQGVPFTALLALGAAVFLDLLFAKTALGYRIRAFGENPSAARYGGIIPVTLSLFVFLLGGAFAGLAGYHYFAAVPGVYKIPGNYGYYGDLGFYGIISALIARGSSLGAVPIAVLFAGLSLGARFAQGALRLPFGVDYALLGLLMMTFIASHVLYQFRLIWRRVEAQAPAIAAEMSRE
ncbi:MAG: ABC transporter permease [Armatimonadota bacterium]|nr:ABC transporter permease [Armatimonadota bacterium]MDR7426197.1 ABC transporter permease [Armatimonadota bacterium]MDR7464038.1 ABC transporter permease [Armatimonadota bacterium]MDR7469026.1 ABC transporter permease [Armatimonadota bacterium]MDR7475544.1 ABC transporter permease [Armatimonadota bacterium]